MFIDGLQYCNWSKKIFEDWRSANLTAVHVTISYHEQFRETVSNFEKWNLYFENFSNLIMPAYTMSDIEYAKANKKTAVIFGSVMASFCVEKFGTQKLTEITKEDVLERAQSFVDLSSFNL